VVQGKALLQSKVFWFSILFVVISIANYFGFDSFKPDDKLSGLVETSISILAAAFNIYLRMKTSQPITSFK
jgi:hypothetical protein